ARVGMKSPRRCGRRMKSGFGAGPACGSGPTSIFGICPSIRRRSTRGTPKNIRVSKSCCRGSRRNQRRIFVARNEIFRSVRHFKIVNPMKSHLLRSAALLAGVAALGLTGCETTGVSSGGNYNVVAYKPHNPDAVKVKVSIANQAVYVMEGEKPL